MQNNIPYILERKDWTKYKLWQELGGDEAAKRLVYGRLMKKRLPDSMRWETIKRVAKALDVSIDELEVIE